MVTSEASGRIPEAALLLIDIQNDFLPGGALAVPEGNRVIPIANRVQRHFDVVLATQDWHPPNHKSFAASHPGQNVGDVIDLNGLEQVLWPVHCVQDQPGSELAAELDVSRVARIFQKGEDPEIDSYSGFFDNGHRRATGLAAYLADHGVRAVYLLGLATDYCVKFTALDARQLGLETWVIEDGCRGVNLQPKDVDLALQEMQASGVQRVTSQELAQHGIES